MNSCCVAVTGLPASGKSTLGREIAARLKWPFFDKDTFLEQLFGSFGTGDSEWRQSLSTMSNDLFRMKAEAHQRVVLASHWRPPDEDGPSGTPTDWLAHRYDSVVEVCCVCPVEVAVQRFSTRTRHPGHLDGRRKREDLEAWMRRYVSCLPLSLGAQIHVSTVDTVPLDALVSEIRHAIRVDP